MSLRNVLLALLSKRPNSGYGLGRLLQKRLRHLWDARLQQIYSELAKLYEDGLVEVETIDLPNRPAKKIYSLSAAGREALDSWLAGACGPCSNKDELLVRLYCLERMPRDVLARRLEERRDEYERGVQELRETKMQTSRTDPLQAGLLLTLEAAIARAEAQIVWCTKATSRLREGDEAADEPAGRSRLRAASA